MIMKFTVAPLMSLIFISSGQIGAYADVFKPELEIKLGTELVSQRDSQIASQLKIDFKHKPANVIATMDMPYEIQSKNLSAILRLADIDLGYFPENSGTYNLEKKYKPVKRNVKKKQKKVTKRKPKMRSIQGYQTTVDAKGNKTREYVHGEVEKGRQGVYTGYLYGQNNKKTFTHGNPSSGTMQVEQDGEMIMETERKAHPQY